MTFRLQIILLIISIFSFGLVFKLITKGILQLKYSILWLVVGLSFTIMAAFPIVLNIIADILGVVTPVNALFLIGCIFLLVLVFSLTIAVSKYSDKVRELSQQVALLKKELKK